MLHRSIMFCVLLLAIVFLGIGLAEAQRATRRDATDADDDANVANTTIPTTPAATDPPTNIPNAITDGNLTYVKDSGICETTPGVHQVSGYINVSNGTYLVRGFSTEQSCSMLKLSQWFWFFAARANPDTAPLTLW